MENRTVKNIILKIINSLKDTVKLDKRKGIIGIILGVLSLVLCCICSKWYMGVAFAIVFSVVGFIKLDIKNNILKYLLNFIWAAVIAYFLWYSAAVLVDAVKYLQSYLDKVLLNMLCVFVLYAILFLITANWKLSVTISAVILIVLSTANGFIYQFRGKELGPMDILSIKTAINVAGQYNAKVTLDMVYTWIIWVLIIFLQGVFPNLPKLSKIWVRVGALVVEIVFIITLFVCTTGMSIKTWETQGTQVNGYYLNFFLGIRYSMIDKPEDYALEVIDEYAQDCAVSGEASEKKPLPNIIAIMDESFADFRVLGSELKTNQPVTPFLDSLKENTIRGKALSSVYAGNTANSEFEFLTGHSMAFLPENTVPYQQYISKNIYTLPWLMEYYGYNSISTHPYHANGWSRNRIYPYLGFSESTFLGDYKSPEYFRCYVSDKTTFDFMLQKLKNKKEGEPLFMFGITMQNHGSYTYTGDNYTQSIELEGYNAEYPHAEQYLSTIHETDSAMQYLIEELEKYPEDTIVLFFGDHFPGVEQNLYVEIHGKYFDTLSERMLQYTIPYMIWANYDIPEETIEQATSINYLSSRLLNVAGLELPPYQRFLADMEKVIPAINAYGYYSISKNDFIPHEEAEGEEAEWLKKYSILQYNNLHDFKHRNTIFFNQYINSTENNK